jgi:hypothetical protein
MQTQIRFLALALLMFAAPANAQGTQQTTGVRTPRYAPFDSGWAKPFPQTGGYFNGDPRLRYQGSRAVGVCPPGLRRSGYGGSCY